MPLPEAAEAGPLGFNRTFAVILLSVILGAAVGFIVQTAFGGLKLLETRWGWILFAVGICFSVRLALKPLSLGSRLDLNGHSIHHSCLEASGHLVLRARSLLHGVRKNATAQLECD
jgi:hypothetical protein